MVIHTTGSRYLLPGLLGLLWTVTGQVCSAADTASEASLFDWHYAATFGTGIYRVGDRTATVFSLPLKHELRKATREQPGVRLTTPINVGIYDFDVLAVPEREQLGGISVLPGAEFIFLMDDDWVLTPHFNLGFGHSLDGSKAADATIYSVGVKSRWYRPLGQVTFMLGNDLSYAGYDPDGGPRQDITRLVTGFNFFVPLDARFGADDLGLHLIYYHYFDGLDVAEVIGGELLDIHHELELGLTLGRHDGWKLLGLRFERLGIALRGGDDLAAIRLTTELPF
jgi:hypothetical protein